MSNTERIITAPSCTQLVVCIRELLTKLIENEPAESKILVPTIISHPKPSSPKTGHFQPYKQVVAGFLDAEDPVRHVPEGVAFPLLCMPVIIGVPKRLVEPAQFIMVPESYVRDSQVVVGDLACRDFLADTFGMRTAVELDVDLGVMRNEANNIFGRKAIFLQ